MITVRKHELWSETSLNHANLGEKENNFKKKGRFAYKNTNQDWENEKYPLSPSKQLRSPPCPLVDAPWQISRHFGRHIGSPGRVRFAPQDTLASLLWAACKRWSTALTCVFICEQYNASFAKWQIYAEENNKDWINGGVLQRHGEDIYVCNIKGNVLWYITWSAAGEGLRGWEGRKKTLPPFHI